MTQQSDLAVETFLALRKTFFDEGGGPVSFPLRHKRNTQDDPLDEYIAALLKEKMPEDVACKRSSGPLISPDLVMLRPDLCVSAARKDLRDDLSRIVAIEVKKLERARSGVIARHSGLDYNTTPPCGTVRIYDSADNPLDIRCFYLFICQEPDSSREGHFRLTALALCDGNALNRDFDLYLSIVGERTKQIGLGTYKDGFNRQRPMLVFANPLGAKEIDRQVTIIHPGKNMNRRIPQLSLAHVLQLSTSADQYNEFFAYRLRQDIPSGHKGSILQNPFPTPERDEKTQHRGRFRLDFRVKD